MRWPWVKRSSYNAVLDALKLAIVYIDLLPEDVKQADRKERILEVVRRYGSV